MSFAVILLRLPHTPEQQAQSGPKTRYDNADEKAG
jgi:hypothetical protein